MKTRGGDVRGGFDKLVKANGATACGDTTSTKSGDEGTTGGAITAIVDDSNNTGNGHLISESNKALKLAEGLESFYNAFPKFSKADDFKKLNLVQSIKHDMNMIQTISEHLNETNKRKGSNNDEANHSNEPPPKKKKDDIVTFIETVD